MLEEENRKLRDRVLVLEEQSHSKKETSWLRDDKRKKKKGELNVLSKRLAKLEGLINQQ